MLSFRSLLPAACACAAVLLPASAGAASWPITPVVTGGKITYDGGVSGSLHSTTQEGATFDETAHLDFSMVSYVGDLYGDPAIVDDGGAANEVKTYTSIPGTGTVKGHYQQWDPVTDELVWKDVTCTQTGKALFAPSPARPIAKKLNPGGGVGALDFTTSSTCSDTKKNGTVGSTIAGQMAGALGTQALPPGTTEPPAGASKTWDLPLNAEGSCPPETGLTCNYTYSGAGHVKVECAICLTNVTLEQRDVRTGALEPVPAAGTIDGNRVFVTATFTNTSPYAVRSKVSWRDRVSRRTLVDAGQSTDDDDVTTFPAGGTTKVTLEWDTNGFAYEKRLPRSDRELEVRTGWGGGYVKVKVLPKPIVAVHGWAAKADGWDVAKQLIPSAIHPELAGRVYAVGDANGVGVMDTDPDSGLPLIANANAEATYIQSIREKADAQHVDLLAHSMGGLISRYYINKLMPAPGEDARPMASHLVMLGTPNMGSPCADAALLLFDGIPTHQLRPKYVEGIFNQQITDRRGVPFSLMAGNIHKRTCTSPQSGDLVVELTSAWWTLEDIATVDGVNHMDLTDKDFIYAGFVKQRIGLDPDEAENAFQEGSGGRPSAAALRAESGAPNPLAATDPTPGADLQTALVEDVTIPADGAVEVPVPVGTASALVVGTSAPASVAATLVAPSGTVADTVAAGSDDARAPARFQRVEAPAAGTWTLWLSQSGGSARTARVTAAFEGSPLALHAARDGGRVTATLREGAAGVDGATVTATLRAAGQAPRTIALHDDGAGSYSADVDVPDAEWYGTAHAVSGRGERFVALDVAGGGVAEPTPPGDGGGGGDGGGNDGQGDDDNGNGGQGDGNGGNGGANPGGSLPPAPAPAPDARGSSSRGGAATPPVARRAATVRVSLTAAKARVRRAPYRFALRGALSKACPTGTKVMIKVTAGRRTVVKTTVSVTKACRFNATVKVAGRGRLKATATVMASAKVAAATSRPVSLRAG